MGRGTDTASTGLLVGRRRRSSGFGEDTMRELAEMIARGDEAAVLRGVGLLDNPRASVASVRKATFDQLLSPLGPSPDAIETRQLQAALDPTLSKLAATARRDELALAGAHQELHPEVVRASFALFDDHAGRFTRALLDRWLPITLNTAVPARQHAAALSAALEMLCERTTQQALPACRSLLEDATGRRSRVWGGGGGSTVAGFRKRMWDYLSLEQTQFPEAGIERQMEILLQRLDELGTAPKGPTQLKLLLNEALIQETYEQLIEALQREHRSLNGARSDLCQSFGGCSGAELFRIRDGDISYGAFREALIKSHGLGATSGVEEQVREIAKLLRRA